MAASYMHFKLRSPCFENLIRKFERVKFRSYSPASALRAHTIGYESRYTLIIVVVFLYAIIMFVHFEKGMAKIHSEFFLFHFFLSYTQQRQVDYGGGGAGKRKKSHKRMPLLHCC